MNPTLLIELGCEELPANALRSQARQLAEGLFKGLVDAGLTSEAGQVNWLATPRRLAVRIDDVAARQPDRLIERKGPAEQAAFDADGQPTRAALGFARSVGLDVDKLDRLENEQGRWLYAEIRQPGQALAELAQELLERVVRDMASARSMRWSDRSDRFLRPVRWLLALHGEEVVPVTLFGLNADRQTRGHRIHAPGPHEVTAVGDYERLLESAFVLADFDRRRAVMAEQVRRCAEQAGLEIRPDDALLDEVTGLVEWPVAVVGSFDPAFLEVPAEALVSAMRIHQKCFPLYRADGTLAPKFITVANLESLDPPQMIHGFERVIRPRLADARFFFEQDRHRPLAARLDRLATMQFQDRLGTLADKTARIRTLGRALADAFSADPTTVERAATLAKCDLMTEMVGEFPELQGTMGRHYALADGEPEAVAVAIESHYLPRHAGDALPEDPAGRALAAADRLDTLVGVFAAGKRPKGSKDPFALRRAAQGVVRILHAAEVRRSLSELVDDAATVLADQLTVSPETRAEVTAFILDRLRAWLTERGLAVNTVRAVEATGIDVIADFVRRAEALQRFADDPEMESLIAANKRAANLLRQSGVEDFGDVDDDLLQIDAEVALFDAVMDAEAETRAALEAGDDATALSRLSALKPAVDAFFDQVMVMDESDALRNNRLALLHRLRTVFLHVADVALLGRA
ncbi:glycine--tRNA ligase subunit beta [Wenzhouxiangella sp. XN79A]|uniref:glycine--tRNA ligase subunit beta n=1 Tax=Wenzhouxiangella sp. XN79A TaxID=2724193 RepID=UPI00144A4E3B|nr:glycine--tRNA ligase subunit beta [Wenzhouxiangella sp. XN79A]NKI33819.1 glycine--tRNA ligase subunit beta [Wenzhouxiangella sp. XN79A]